MRLAFGYLQIDRLGLRHETLESLQSLSPRQFRLVHSKFHIVEARNATCFCGKTLKGVFELCDVIPLSPGADTMIAINHTF